MLRHFVAGRRLHITGCNEKRRIIRQATLHLPQRCKRSIYPERGKSMRELKNILIGLVAVFALSATGMCVENADSIDVNDVVVKTIQQEHQFTGKMRQYMPLNEIYIQK